jgi:hypothetical protein
VAANGGPSWPPLPEEGGGLNKGGENRGHGTSSLTRLTLRGRGGGVAGGSAGSGGLTATWLGNGEWAREKKRK